MAHKVPQGSVLVLLSSLIFPDILSHTLLFSITALFILTHSYDAVSCLGSPCMEYLPFHSMHIQWVCGTARDSKCWKPPSFKKGLLANLPNFALAKDIIILVRKHVSPLTCRETDYVFQGCLVYKHSWTVSLKQKFC